MFVEQNFCTYLLALTIAAAVPGPGMITILINTIKNTKMHGWFTLFGLITGDFLYLTLSLIFIKFLHQFIDPKIIQIIIMIGAFYLLYIAIQIWASNIREMNQNHFKFSPTNKKIYKTSYGQGLLVTMSNPKTMTFYIALLPPFLSANTMFSLEQIFSVYVATMFVLVLIGGLYISLAIIIMKYLCSQRKMDIIMKLLASIMAFISLSLIYSNISAFT
ncbi:LysE family translocator [Acinetobacter sp. DSM 11652]|uniref:LysE family translocator n=1 Tax=Acinetobacter sp. DSM 11652 TaxID=346222 RepID=UPI0008B3CC59|nr:LysE family translocator [Acinetobacter sp. DSM 11652]SEM25500.1 Threonine/homoserine/homoserine lactone efflux protein [Acinetobacter sp. DSM 11652]